MHPIAHAQSRPDQPAVIVAETGQQITFAEMDREANRFAHLLRKHGLKPNEAFATLLENRIEYFPIIWGSQRIGTMMVPISSRLTAPEISYILRDSESKLLITSPYFAEVLEGIRRECPDLTILVMDGANEDGREENFADALTAQPTDAPDDQTAGLTMLYSSGTTGKPKGIRPAPPEDPDPQAANPLMGLAMMGAQMPADGSMVYLSPAPLYHAAPIGWCTTAQRLGGTVVMMQRFDPEAALQAIETYKVTDSQWVPTHFVRMLKLPEEVRTQYDLSSHKRALHAAAPCPVEIKRQMIDWWGPIVNEYYAGSESIGMTMVHAPQWLENPGTVGKSIFGTLHVCGPDGEELPAGEDGLIFYENDRLPQYHNDPDKIENLLVEHPKVMDAAVIGAPDPDLGERVVAVVQPVDIAAAQADGGDALEQELRDALDGQLSRVKMPKAFDFRAELPREANGKLYKRELRDEYAAKA